MKQNKYHANPLPVDLYKYIYLFHVSQFPSYDNNIVNTPALRLTITINLHNITLTDRIEWNGLITQFNLLT